MTVSEWLRNAREALASTGCPDPEIDARWIAEDKLNMSRTELKFEGDRALNPEALAGLNAALERRMHGEPVQYILESADFMGLKFHVDKRVLIPRQDTESLVEAAIAALISMKEPKVLDMCTGSGCIGLSIGSLVPHARITLSDISKDALDVARTNAKTLGVDAVLRHGDLFAAVGKDRFDLIASNPPYIPRGDLSGLQREVQHEPMLALDGGADGLDLYRRIAQGAKDHLNPGGYIYLEVGIDEARDVLDLLKENIDCADAGVIKDLCGVERVVWARSK
ncbi:MAG: peptide chain release factor N(5)-glutamine methyltransferase [Clostridiales bacterium]|nr:peptide chain release factor N(5)-glutamine methyltransferase [Clostridiales bacterium]